MSRMLRIYLLETWYELLKALRLPSYSIPTLTFPVVFYLFFGVMWGSTDVGPVDMSSYLIATYGVFGAMGAALLGFGVSVAAERGQGWLETKRITPMPISVYFVAKIVMAMTFSVVIFLLLLTTGTLLANVHIEPMQALLLLGVMVFGSIPFCAIGLAIGFYSGPSSVSSIANLIYLPLGFLSGLWIPITFLPQVLHDTAMWLPSYHAGQLALHVIGASAGEPLALHIGILLITTIMFLTIAWAGHRIDQGKTYG